MRSSLAITPSSSELNVTDRALRSSPSSAKGSRAGLDINLAVHLLAEPSVVVVCEPGLDPLQIKQPRAVDELVDHPSRQQVGVHSSALRQGQVHHLTQLTRMIVTVSITSEATNRMMPIPSPNVVV